MSWYSEKLQDPRWQKKRLEILQRDNFTCLGCEATDKTLHVHHTVYVKGVEPWDYDQSLMTLCSDCHEARPLLERDIIINCSRLKNTELVSLRDLLGSIFGLKKRTGDES
jgi:hypothetical protein